MRKRLAWAVLMLCALASSGCHGGMVRLETAPGSGRYKWHDPLPAEAFREPCAGLEHSIQTPVGYSEARKDPLVGFAVNARFRWNSAVDPLTGYFDELCERHNDAQITLSEFEARERELTEAAVSLTEWRDELTAVLAQYEAAEDVKKGAEREGARDERTASLAAADMGAARGVAESLIQRAAALVSALAPPPAAQAA